MATPVDILELVQQAVDEAFGNMVRIMEKF